MQQLGRPGKLDSVGQETSNGEVAAPEVGVEVFEGEVSAQMIELAPSSDLRT